MGAQLYTFLAPGDIMAEGDEMIEPWFTWQPIPARYIGQPVTTKGAPRVRRPAPDLLSCLEGCAAFLEVHEDEIPANALQGASFGIYQEPETVAFIAKVKDAIRKVKGEV